MRYIKVWCANKTCRESSIAPQTIAGYRIAAPGVLERLGTLVCDTCGHDMKTEPVS